MLNDYLTNLSAMTRSITLSVELYQNVLLSEQCAVRPSRACHSIMPVIKELD